MSFFLHKNKEILAEYGTMQGTWSSVFCKEMIVYLPSTCAENIVLHKYTKKKMADVCLGPFQKFLESLF